jgi:cytochrome b involved in lipid metabolism
MMTTQTTERDFLNDPASNSRSFNNSEMARIKDLSLQKRSEMCLNPTNQFLSKKLKNSQLPTLLITSPTGKRITLSISERTKFYEPYGKTNYFYLSRLSEIAEPGTYSFLITARTKSSITVAVGDREIPGNVIRGVPTPPPTPTVTPTVTATPTPTPTVTKSSYTMADVRANATPTKCWSAIDGNVYDLTRWISSHPGGSSPIRFLCGIDGTNAFKAQHANQSNPMARLTSYLLGPLTP